MKDRASNFLLLCISVGISIIIFEIGARVLTPFPLNGMPNTVPHDKLGYTLTPKLFGIDRHGFRNSQNQDKPSIVALGDSHTYGYNVTSHNSWPYQLARKSDLAVYNYGIGGYGILQYVLLFEEAIKKRPEHIILGFYLANDLKDYCGLATLPYWQEILRRANLKYDICVVKRNYKTSKLMRPIKLTLKRTAAGSAFEYYIWNKLVELFGWHIDIEHDNHKTYMSYRRLIKHINAMDAKDARINEAIKASEYFFSQMVEKAREHNIKFSVLFIPSKERVFYEWVKSNNVRIDEEYDVHYEKLFQHEEALVRRFQKFFSNHGVETEDALPYMRGALKEGRRLYQRSDDTHPLELGYSLYADAALKLVACGAKSSIANRTCGATAEIIRTLPSFVPPQFERSLTEDPLSFVPGL